MNAWIKRKTKPDEVVSIIHDIHARMRRWCTIVYTAFEEDELGRILFDDHGYWIYDGEMY